MLITLQISTIMANDKSNLLSAFFNSTDESPQDFYVEVLLALLMEEDKITWDDFIIRTTKGSFERSYRRDILGVTSIQKEKEQKERIYIDISRDGIYDILPEGIFHQTQIDKSVINTEDSVEEIKRHRQEEKHARKFFLPLEQEFFRQRILLVSEELHSQVNPVNAMLNKLYLKFWNITTPLTAYQASALLFLLPIAHYIAGNIPMTQQCFSLVLQHPVTITFEQSISDGAWKVDIPSLGQTELGKSFILGDTLEVDNATIALTLGPIPEHQLPDYLAGAKGMELVQLLSNYLLPVSSETVIHVQVEDAESRFILGATNEQGRLGYTTVV